MGCREGSKKNVGEEYSQNLQGLTLRKGNEKFIEGQKECYLTHVLVICQNNGFPVI